MNAQTLAKQGGELLTFWRSEYKKKTGSAAMLNTAKEKWAARDLVESFGLDKCKEAVVWYMRINKRPEWNTFLYTATSVISEMESVKNDKTKRAAYRRVANEWRNG